MFGYAKGAFTGATAKRIGRIELAQHGTLFLDEIGELAPEMQSKLLLVMEENSFERVGEAESTGVDIRLFRPPCLLIPWPASVAFTAPSGPASAVASPGAGPRSSAIADWPEAR